METTTNTPSEQVEHTENNEDIQPEESTNAEESVSPESSYDDAYDKAFNDVDLDNPDTTVFAEQSNVSDEPEEPTEVNEEVVEESNDPFSLTEDGYLAQELVDRGRTFRVTPEELFAFANKGLNYEEKNREIKPFKPYMQVLKENNVDVEDVKALADFVGGKKEALKHLLSKYDADVYDIDASEEQYTPEVEQYNSDPVAEIWSDLQKTDPEGSEVVANTFNDINEEFRQEVYNEDVFPAFADDVKNGVFEKLYPEAQKLKALYPKATWLQAYAEADKRLSKTVSKKEVPTEVRPPVDMGTPQNHSVKADDIWNDEDAYKAMEQLTI